MGIFSDFLWTLAGGTYAAGSLFKENVQSQGFQHKEEVHNFGWYQAHALELDHERQEELLLLYKKNLNAFEILADWKESDYNDNPFYRSIRCSSGGRQGRYFPDAASKIASREGWLYDEDFRLDEDRKYLASDKAMADMVKYKEYVKEERSKFEESVSSLNIPYIGENYHWWIAGKDTGFLATPQSFPLVTDEGMWKFGRTKTEYFSLGGVFPPVTDSRTGAVSIAAELYPRDDGYWYINIYFDNKPSNTGIKVIENVDRPVLKEDGYFWYSGERTNLKVVPVSKFYEIKGSNSWGVSILLELETEPYKDQDGNVRNTKTIDDRRVDTGIPIIKRYRLRTDSVLEAKIEALTEAAWVGWESDTQELRECCESIGCERALNTFLVERDNNRRSYPDRHSLASYGSKGYNAKQLLIKTILSGLGVAKSQSDDKTLNTEQRRRREAHENRTRQTELWRILYYAKKGSEEAKLDYYRLTDECYEETIEAYGDEFYLDDIELDEDSFGKNGCALEALKTIAKSEGWLWDDNYPSPAKQKQLEYDFEREKSYSDPTPLPWNHERQESIYRDRFYATELKDKAAQKSLLLFTGTKDSARLSEEKFFKLCAECAREEGWAWDFDYFTPAKCREIIRECAMEE